MNHSLLAITPIDGRYYSKTEDLIPYFSEYALISYRVRVEIQYLIAISKLGLKNIPPLSEIEVKKLQAIYLNFSIDDAKEVKEIEQVTNHDVKAVEYFLKGRLQKIDLESCMEFIHFGLTSQDVNNTALPMMIQDSLQQVILPILSEMYNELLSMSKRWKDVSMLAKTHGQPASPTTLGKEIMIFADRVDKQIATIKSYKFVAKFGGATGNFNAHLIAYPEIDWRIFGDQFIDSLGMSRIQYTSQIDSYDHIAKLCHNFIRINSICIDICQDIWLYISMNYFTQKTKDGGTYRC